MIQDLRYGLRVLRRSPGFSLLAILCLTLGIGTNAAVFSWIEGILLRPFPLVADQGRLLAVAGTNRGAADTTFPAAMALVGYWLLALPTGWWLAFRAGLGARGLWWGFTVGLAAVALLLLLRIAVRFRRPLARVGAGAEA